VLTDPLAPAKVISDATCVRLRAVPEVSPRSHSTNFRLRPTWSYGGYRKCFVSWPKDKLESKDSHSLLRAYALDVQPFMRLSVYFDE
jgi:hypothetical protein